MKKFLVVFLFVLLCALPACKEPDIKEYRLSAIKDLNSYMENIIETLDDETDDGVFLDIVSMATDEIVRSETIEQIDEIVFLAKSKIDDNVPITGEIYTLSEALSNQAIFNEDLTEMAQAIKDRATISVDELPPNVAAALIEEYPLFRDEEGIESYILSYYGNWHGAYLVVMALPIDDLGLLGGETVNGTEFEYYGPAPIIWVTNQK